VLDIVELFFCFPFIWQARLIFICLFRDVNSLCTNSLLSPISLLLGGSNVKRCSCCGIMHNGGGRRSGYCLVNMKRGIYDDGDDRAVCVVD